VTTPTELTVNVTVQADAAADDEELSTLRDYVRVMLTEHEFNVADYPVTADAPAGAKAGDPVSVASLVVALAASGGALTTLIGALHAWLQRGSAQHVVIEIGGDRLEISGATSAERRGLSAAWLARHQPVEDREQADDR
jgi:hypothetical protein